MVYKVRFLTKFFDGDESEMRKAECNSTFIYNGRVQNKTLFYRCNEDKNVMTEMETSGTTWLNLCAALQKVKYEDAIWQDAIGNETSKLGKSFYTYTGLTEKDIYEKYGEDLKDLVQYLEDEGVVSIKSKSEEEPPQKRANENAECLQDTNEAKTDVEATGNSGVMPLRIELTAPLAKSTMNKMLVPIRESILKESGRNIVIAITLINQIMINFRNSLDPQLRRELDELEKRENGEIEVSFMDSMSMIENLRVYVKKCKDNPTKEKQEALKVVISAVSSQPKYIRKVERDDEDEDDDEEKNDSEDDENIESENSEVPAQTINIDIAISHSIWFW